MATIEHDAKLWGWARAADDERSHLVRVGDLVSALARVEQRAAADAAGIVLDRLAGAALFELRKDGDARPVTADYRFAKDGGHFWIEGAEGFLGFPSADALEDLTGVCGAHEMLGRHRLTDPGLERGIAARFAVLEQVAAAVFPELFHLAESRPKAASTPPDRGALQAAALAAAAPPADFVRGKAWTDAHKVAFVGAYDALIAAGMGKDAALSELASKGWANSGKTLTKRITEGNEARAKSLKQGASLRAA